MPLSWSPHAMPLFARLRRCATRLPGRALLAWFALTIAAAVAAPVAHSGTLQDVCTSAGVAAVSAGAGGAGPPAPSHLDCPLCVPTAPPPPPYQALPATQPAPSSPPRWTMLARAAGHEGRAPPVRGPPAL
ncbi:MAG: hypothetical protein WA917_08490 [Comamonas sp.]